MPDSSGKTFAQLYEAYGQPIPARPDIPIGFNRLLDLFYVLNARRPEGWSGPRPLNIEAVHAYLNIAGLKMTAVELEVLLQLDDEWLQALSDAKADHKEREAE